MKSLKQMMIVAARLAKVDEKAAVKYVEGWHKRNSIEKSAA